MTRQPDKQFWIPSAVLLLLVVLTFFPVFQAGFIWDDDSMLTNNMFVKARNGLGFIWFSTEPVDYFPLTYTSLWLEWRLFGMNAGGYHLFSVLLQAFSAVLLWRIFVRLKVPGAWLAAALFAVHPVNVESVAWIAERKNTLCFFFFALTLLLFLRFEENKKRSTYIFCVGAFVAALLSKTAVVPLPFVLLLFAWWQRGKIEKGDVQRSLPFFAVSFLFGLITLWFQHYRAIGGDEIRDADVLSRLTQAGSAIVFYFSKAILPLDLCFVYPSLKHSGGITSSLLGVLSAVVVLWRRQWKGSRAFVSGFCCFVLFLLPILGFVDIYFHRYAPVADHWAYFALPAMTVLIAVAVMSWPNDNSGYVRNTIALILVLGFAVLSFRHVGIFHDPETLWRDTLRKNPSAWLAHNNLGLLLEAQGKTEEAEALYHRSLLVMPEQVEARNNLGSIFFGQNKNDAAMAEFQTALKLNPRLALTHYNIANVLDREGKRSEAVKEYKTALELDPNYVDARNNLGCLYLMEGKLDDGIVQLQAALAVNPDESRVLNNLGSALVERGRVAEAVPLLRHAAELKPDCADPPYNLGNAFVALGQLREAVAQYSLALQIDPKMAVIHYKYGNVLLQLNESEHALREYMAAISLRSDYAEAHYQAAVILNSQKKFSDAIAYYKEALRVKPDWVEALNNLAWILATRPEPQIRDGKSAMQYARHAVELTESKNPGTLDTLAASYAENGQFKEAVQTAEAAVQLAEKAKAADLARQIGARLKLYQSQQRFRE